MSVKGLERAIQNLNSLSRLIVPEATAKALNRVASRTISQGSKAVAKEATVDDNRKKGLPVRLVRQRSRLRKARHDRPVASIKINRGNLPAIKLGTARVRLSRKKGARNGAGSVLKIGPYTFRNAFIQQLSNGRWQVMRRVGHARYPNGTVDVFRGWCSSLGKAIPAKEVITRTAKITNTGKPELAEESGTPNIPVTGVTLDKATASVVVGATTTLNVTVNPASASDTSFRVATSDGAKATVTVSGNAITVTGVAAGTADVIVMTSDGNFVAVCKVTVTAA